MDVVIVDDEPLARQRLARMVENLKGYQVVAQADCAQAALEAIASQDPDVVLLDVRMPGGDGIEAARQIGAMDDPPAVIFCTAFDEYALDAFGTEAVGYLLKPVRSEQLEEVLERAKRPNRLQRASVQKTDQPARSHISAKTHRGMELIPLDDIRAFVADQKYVTVHHLNGEHLLDETLKDLEEEFGDRLLRIHRSVLVSVPHIQAMERNSQGQYYVRLADSELHPQVSRRHASALKAVLQRL
ncbi:LytTR family DNA-binding domain-containing protein [Marinimicrobium sp. ABcell2]|uniref:LytR/AlgR family response regulator transcription factor n=1 Tax=Marinimicrobium sp. ABcell2 TaxID=3069751 RepID=UPI0027B5C599|nr:LytTR family DNA-binding domain-containing protein [Marinimicrobium sp. ABcell2]MDQ2076919.1 LytTR family DNA-binding domain-containing protein [Marinimicrobium sp. ABcell2]